MVNIKRKYISNWEIEIDEISNNYWEGIARRNSGNIVSCQGSDPEEILRRLENDFWDVELQLTDNISNLLLNYLREKTTYEGQKVCLLQQPEHFGSWIISNSDRQVIYDGRERWFVMRDNRDKGHWIDKIFIRLNDISPKNINQLYFWLMGLTS